LRGGSGAKGTKLPDGSITWRQGIFWKWIAPTDLRQTSGILKPRTLQTGITPIGARFIDQRTPEQTVQMIGDPGASVPDVAVDLGIADIYIKDNAQRIVYTGRGLTTDAGRSIASPRTGMTIGGVEPEGKGHAYARKVYPKSGISRTAMDTEVPMSVREIRGKDRVDISERTKEMVEGTYEEPEPVKDTDDYGNEALDELGPEGTYFDETDEFISRFNGEPKKKTAKNRANMRKTQPRRRRDNPPTTLGGMRL
jgi:hypothetical protein